MEYIWLKVNEAVQIGPATVVLVQCPAQTPCGIDRKKCRIGVDAPRSVRVWRKEILEAIQKGQQ